MIKRYKLDKNERDLLDRLRKGEERAFDRLFEENQEMVLRVAYNLVGEREAAKDVLQEVFISIHKNLAGFAGRSSLRTWIYRITFNAALAQTKKRSFLPLFDFLFQKAGTSDPLEEAQQSELTERLRQAISHLPIRQKRVFVLKTQEGLSYADIAEVLETKIGTVKSWVSRATNKLKEMLGEEKDDYL